MSVIVNWGRFHRPGYEVSSKGDKRFSAFFARLPDGKSIEYHYQVGVKGYPSISEGKGKPPLNESVDLWEEYLKLWKEWAIHNPELIEELRSLLPKYDFTLTDMFATSKVNQARALATILNGN
jgi:hypothetical protein